MTINPRDGSTAVRVALCLEAWTLALILALPDNTFALSHGYDRMAAVMGEMGWAAVLAANGALGLAALLWPAHRLVMTVSALAAFTYGWVALSILSAAPASLGTAAYGTPAALALWTVWLEASRLRRP